MRNFDKYPFVSCMSDEKKKKFENEAINFINDWQQETSIFNTNILNNNEKKIFSDNNLIDETYFETKNGTFIILPVNNISILLNYINHINISILKPMLHIKEGYSDIEKIESVLGKRFPYAASTKYGFLTPYINTCGLALKISALIHVPGLYLAKKIKETFNILSKSGYGIKPWRYDKGTKDTAYFMVSSRLNFGVSEEQLIQRFIKGIENLIEIDQEALIKYYNKNKDSLVDTIYRSYGILKYATQMDYSEALNHLSNIRIGLKCGKNLPIPIDILNRLFILIKDGHVNILAKEKNIGEKKARANIIRTLLN
ncbi:MAG: hypothetical protein KAT05_16705 [Spirochaetes bacterium]|nr:hypothetical protein [Spirochaetota bacterium]